MASFNQKIESLLADAFPPPASIELRDEDGIVGIVVSKEFEDLDTMDRLDSVWKVLDAGLTAKEKRQILIIVAVTPEEHAAHLSN